MQDEQNKHSVSIPQHTTGGNTRDKRLDEIMQAVENIYRNLVLLGSDIDSDYLDDARRTLREFEITDLKAIRQALEANK